MDVLKVSHYKTLGYSHLPDEVMGTLDRFPRRTAFARAAVRHTLEDSVF